MDARQQQEPKGPAQFISVRAGTDAQGNLVAWDYMERGFPWTRWR